MQKNVVEEISLFDLGKTLARYYWIILTSIAISLAIGITAIAYSPKLYRVETTVLPPDALTFGNLARKMSNLDLNFFPDRTETFLTGLEHVTAIVGSDSSSEEFLGHKNFRISIQTLGTGIQNSTPELDERVLSATLSIEHTDPNLAVDMLISVLDQANERVLQDLMDQIESSTAEAKYLQERKFQLAKEYEDTNPSIYFKEVIANAMINIALLSEYTASEHQSLRILKSETSIKLPDIPIRPNKIFILLLSICIGSFSGVVAALAVSGVTKR